MRHRIAVALILILACFGVFAIAIFAHELTHVIHGGDTVTGLCVDLNQKISDEHQEGFMLAHTVFDTTRYPDIATFSSFRELSEKYASIVQYIIMIGLSFLIGVLVMRRPVHVTMIRPTTPPAARPPAPEHPLPPLPRLPDARGQLPRF